MQTTTDTIETGRSALAAMGASSVFEYQVVEEASDGSWYGHGYEGEDDQAAYADLGEKRMTYSQYGRNFSLRRRLISQWEPAPGVSVSEEARPYRA